MNGIGPLARPSTALPRALLGIVLAVVVTACGGTASGAAASAAGGGGDYDTVIAKAQAAFGNSMVSGTVENGDTLRITLTEATGASMAKLFLCSNVKDALTAAGLGSSKVIIVDTTGAQLSTQADCKK